MQEYLNQFLSYPGVEGNLIMLVLALVSGIIGLTIRYYFVQKGKNKWGEVNTVDKYFISFTVGFVSIGIVTISFLIYGMISDLVSLIFQYKFGTNLESFFFYTVFICISYQVFVALVTEKKVHNFEYLKHVYKPKNLVSGTLFALSVYLWMFGKNSGDIMEMFFGVVSLTAFSVINFPQWVQLGVKIKPK